MRYGIFEMKEFADNSDDPRVKLMFKRLQETRSKLARSTEEIVRLTKQRDELTAALWNGEISRRSIMAKKNLTPIKIINEELAVKYGFSISEPNEEPSSETLQQEASGEGG